MVKKDPPAFLSKEGGQSEGACENFRLNMAASTFSVCLCGMSKSAHKVRSPKAEEESTAAAAKAKAEEEARLKAKEEAAAAKVNEDSLLALQSGSQSGPA